MFRLELAGDEISIGGLVRICLVFDCGKRALVHVITIHDLGAEMRPVRIIVGAGGSGNRDLPVRGRRCRGQRNTAGVPGRCCIRRRRRNKVDRSLRAERDRGPSTLCDFLDLGGGDGVPSISHPILDLTILFGGPVDLDISAILEMNGIGHHEISGQ